MIKILHSGDWHLDSPLQGRSPEQASFLRRELLKIPGKIADLCREEQCDLMLLSGDLFDGAYTQQTYRTVYEALQHAGVPVFITPGNHDYISPESPYEKEAWPENVHIFKSQQIQWVDLQKLNLRVYGAGFQSMDCPSLLEGFHAEENAVGVFHGDPTQVNSPYNPVTKNQVAQSGLRYLALGHVHKGDGFWTADTLCAWPGCPMGRGWDEQGDKGVLIVTVDQQTQVKFVPLDGPQFFDISVDFRDGVGSVLPAVANNDFYRITLTGEAESIDVETLREDFAAFPNLVLRDQTRKPVDLWQSVGEDNFEGMYFGLLKDALADAEPATKEKILLAAKLSRQILDGQEVVLP